VSLVLDGGAAFTGDLTHPSLACPVLFPCGIPLGAATIHKISMGRYRYCLERPPFSFG